MAMTATRVGPVGQYTLKIIAVTALATARQALVVGSRVLSCVGVNSNDVQAVKVEPNIDSAGAASDGSVAVANADSGVDTAEVWVLVSE